MLKKLNDKDRKRLHRKIHIRKSVYGTADRPRMTVTRSNKNISVITYNVLNLPSKVTFSDGSTIVYSYAADGTTPFDWKAFVPQTDHSRPVVLTDDGVDVVANAHIGDQLHWLVTVIDNVAKDVQNVAVAEIDLFEQLLIFLITTVQVGNDVGHDYSPFDGSDQATLASSMSE